MLAAPQAETLVTDFAFRWLDLLEVNKFEWDKQIFPEFSVELRQDVLTEIVLFLRSILLEDKNVEQLLTADFTFLNERLAKHYGITTVHGAQFRRVHLEDENRYGLLGKGAAPSPFSASEWGKFQDAGFINGAVEIRLAVMGLFPRYL